MEAVERRQRLMKKLKSLALISQDVSTLYNHIALIIKRGKIGVYLRKLVTEMRLVMYPYTAINLRESAANNMKDFLSLVDIYGFSHMMMFTNTEKSSYLKLAKMPKGPTITFKIKDYCLSSDIFKESGINQRPLTKNFDHVPLIIMNGFNSTDIPSEYETALKTTSMMFQSFFPPLNLTEIQMKKCKRVVLVNLNMTEDKEPELLFRHYDIEIEKYSSKKTISNLINSINVNRDFSNFSNIADYVLKQSGFTSQSENEDPNLGECEIINEKNSNQEKIKVKLREIGPRLNLKIHKIEEGFLKGNVIFHSLIKKSKKEIYEIMQELKEKRKEKKKRREEQEKNIKEKEKKKEQKKDEENEEEEEKEGETKFLNKKHQREENNKIDKNASRNKEKNNLGKVQKNKFMKNTKKKINPAKEMVMTKRSLKQFKNLKKYKK